MSKKILVIMDPIESINIKKDTTYQLMLSAQAYGHELYYMVPGSLSINSCEPIGRISRIKLHKEKKIFYEKLEANKIQLSKFDIILMRLDPPVNNDYIYITYILDMVKNKNIKVLNTGSSLRNYNEKLITLNFPNHIPDTILTCCKNELSLFKKKHKKIILKPLNLMGGKSIYLIDESDKNFNVIAEDMTCSWKNYIIAQEYLPDAIQGDKRIIVINGEVIEESVIRVPNNNDHRANLASGGSIKKYNLTQAEIKICKEVAKFLFEKNIFLAGIDMIGNKITEVNITSPTCLAEINDFHNIDLGKRFWEAVNELD